MVLREAWKLSKKFCWRSSRLLLGLLFSATTHAGSTAFYYGALPPVEQLSRFNRVVVEAENVTPDERKSLLRNGVEVIAYVSLGEVNRTRFWFDEVKESWKRGENTAWNSVIVDLQNLEWHRYLLEKRLTPLWNQGYQGFFLDTLDSYMRLFSAEAQAQQRRGLVTLIAEIYRRFPGVKLVLNRGFEVMPEVFQYADGVVAESLFRRWNPVESRYLEVPKADRDWLLFELQRVVKDYHLAVTVIDYLPSESVELTKQVAQKIDLLGFSPWVSVPELNSISQGMLDFWGKKGVF